MLNDERQLLQTHKPTVEEWVKPSVILLFSKKSDTVSQLLLLLSQVCHTRLYILQLLWVSDIGRICMEVISKNQVKHLFQNNSRLYWSIVRQGE